MYIKSTALFVTLYGRGALAALPASCQAGDTDTVAGCTKCSPIGSEYQPPGTGQVWYSHCCTESETATATGVTTSKQYCFSYELNGYPNNQLHGIKPACSKTGGGNTSWSLKGQCSTGGTNLPYVTLPAAISPAGCPGSWDSGNSYKIGDKVEDNGVVYLCSGAAAFCNLYEPNLRGVGENYWKATNSCAGTVSPTASPAFTNTQAGCPEDYDSSTVYGPGDKIAVTRKDGRSVVYMCKAFPQSEFCNVQAYSPLNLAPACNGELCWKSAWTYGGGCDGTYSPTGSPNFEGALDGCPEEYDAGTLYGPSDKVSIIGVGEDRGKIYQCKSWPEGANCVKEAYKPGPGRAYYNGVPLWTQAWSYIGGCEGTISPTGAPYFSGTSNGCPEEYDAGIAYEEGDKVSVKGAGETRGKIYKCKSWPEGANCVKEAYAPGSDAGVVPGVPLWKMAWTYVGGCEGTITPTGAPNFATNDGCPEGYVAGTAYEEGDKVAIKGEGETRGKIYKCKGWPDTGYCELEAYKPGHGGAIHNGVPLWKTAWSYVGGCDGTISPTGAPVFNSLAQWDKDKEGCPEEYAPNNSAYQAGDFVSVSKNSDNTLGVVWQCKNDETWPWCQNEGYAPGTEYGGKAWQKIGHCAGTMSPTAAPTPLTANGDPTKHACQFKYKLPTSTTNEYVVLQAESWVNGGQTIATVTGGTPLTLYKVGTLVRYGRDARKCNSYPYNGYCRQFSPFEQDSSSFNPILSPKGWSETTCEDVQSVTDTGDDRTVLSDTFQPSIGGPVFASNGNLLVNADGECVNGAINPEDYFKLSDVKGCQKWQPSSAPSSQLSLQPSSSSAPSSQLSLQPSSSSAPSSQPSLQPSSSSAPSSQLSLQPSTSSAPSSQLSLQPSSSSAPSSQLSLQPSSSSAPSSQLSLQPSSSSAPSPQPSIQYGSSWTQLGQDIDGEAAYDQAGYSVSLSADGKSVAVGAPNNDGNGSDSGHARVYRLVGSSWTQLGQDIDGEAAYDQAGRSVSLSADGMSVAVGAINNDGNGSNSGHVRVYRLVGSSWTQLGQDIDGEAAGDRSGWSVSLSADGNTVAVGAPYNDGNGSASGHARVYRLEGSSWTQLGQDIDGEAADDRAGWSVSLSSDGNTVAVGAILNDERGSNSGHVRVYGLVGSSWTQLGQDIDGEATSDFSGYSVSLSADGMSVAVGAYLNGSNSGHARVYRLVGSSWTQLGQDIDGEATDDYSGWSVSLSADGNTVAVGASGNDGNGSDSGHARVYRLVGSSWTQLGQDIDGEAAYDQAGYSVSLSADGKSVAVGARYNDGGTGSDSGHVRVYEI